MFRIKICGVTSATDARLAAAAGADAIGLNFYSASRRYLSADAAWEVAAAIPHGVLKVGVFVNADPRFVCRESDRLRLDLIQLAGDESPEYLLALGGRPVMKVFRPRFDSSADLSTVAVYLSDVERLGCRPKLALIDGDQPGQFGGTGKTVDWSVLSHSWSALDNAAPPLVLAGGLRPENVDEAIRVVRPAAVDVASGVESSVAIKDPERMRQFVSAALAAFDSVAPMQAEASGLEP